MIRRDAGASIQEVSQELTLSVHESTQNGKHKLNDAAADTDVDVEMGRDAAPTKKKGIVYYIRHGESAANEANVYAGITDAPLTAFGIKQAIAAGRDLKRKGVTSPNDLDAVYTSHLLRATTTCANVLHAAELIPNADPSKDDEWADNLRPIRLPGLAERSFGIFTGENKVLLRRALGHDNFEELLHSSFEAPPCAETIGSIYKRCEEFHHEDILPRLDRGERVLVVAHQYVLEAMALVLEESPVSEYYSFSLPNGKALTEDDMKLYHHKTTSKIAKRIDAIGDKTILYGTKTSAVLFGLGCLIRGIPAVVNEAWYSTMLGDAIFNPLIAVALAISTWFVYLELDLRNAAANTARSDGCIVILCYIVRILIFCVAGLYILKTNSPLPEPAANIQAGDYTNSIQLWLLLWAIPPALTSPTQALTWGGRVYLAAVGSFGLSIICAICLIGIALSPLISLSVETLVPFFYILAASLGFPAAAAQFYRAYWPIQSKRYSKKWKFLGVAAINFMSFTSALHLTPANIFTDLFGETELRDGQSFNCIRQFQIAFLTYSIIRGGATVASIVVAKLHPSTATHKVNVDAYILLSSHNVFLWIALSDGVRGKNLDLGESTTYAVFWATAFFFILPAIEEEVLTSTLSKRLLQTALSRTKVAAKCHQLDLIWQSTAGNYVDGPTMVPTN